MCNGTSVKRLFFLLVGSKIDGTEIIFLIDKKTKINTKLMVYSYAKQTRIKKKFLAQEVRHQKRDILKRRRVNPYFVCITSNQITVGPVRGHLTPKMNIIFFIRNLMLNIFLFNSFFEKSCIFRENREKLFWGRIWQFFRERRRFTLKINITFFITNEVLNILLFSNFFQKIFNFLRKCQKTVSGAQVSFERKEASDDENEYNLFYGKWGLEYFIV